MRITQDADTKMGRMRTVPGGGYRAFHPASMPRSVELTAATVVRLADAEAALGRLAGAGRLLPNPHLLIRPYLLREALASTRIEGTQASLAGVLEAEAGGDTYGPDVEEVVNYIRALELGLSRLADLPLGMRLMSEMHAILLDGVRGRHRQPGLLRVSQNWIGRPGALLADAEFVPPPPDEIGDLVADWERFVHEDPPMPVLVQSGLLHYQFETIHPYLDGNGRLGRLVIVLHLVMRGRLSSPLLYLSPYFDRNRDEYYERMQTVREQGDLDSWLAFFLTGVEVQANDAVTRAEAIIDLRESYRDRVLDVTRSQAVVLVDVLFAHPILTARVVETNLDVRRPTALRLLSLLVDVGILTEMSSGSRGQRRFVAHELMAAFEEDTSV